HFSFLLTLAFEEFPQPCLSARLNPDHLPLTIEIGVSPGSAFQGGFDLTDGVGCPAMGGGIEKTGHQVRLHGVENIPFTLGKSTMRPIKNGGIGPVRPDTQ